MSTAAQSLRCRSRESPGSCLTQSQPDPCPVPIRCTQEDPSLPCIELLPRRRPVLFRKRPRDVRLGEIHKMAGHGLLDTPMGMSCTLYDFKTKLMSYKSQDLTSAQGLVQRSLLTQRFCLSVVKDPPDRTLLAVRTTGAGSACSSRRCCCSLCLSSSSPRLRACPLQVQLKPELQNECSLPA
jgi:hypothetical protein